MQPHLNVAAVVVVVLLFCLTGAEASVGPNSAMMGVLELNSESFNGFVEDTTRARFVEMYAPWCGHCKSMAPEWARLGELVMKDAAEKVVLGKIDGTSASAIMSAYDATGFPTLLFFPAGSVDAEVYRGGRAIEDFAKYLSARVNGVSLFVPPEPTLAVELSAETLEEVTMDPTRDVVVFFYAPWCGHCKAFKPVYEQVAELFLRDDDLVVARMNADAEENRAVARALDIHSFPTILLYTKGSKRSPKEFRGQRDLTHIVAFLYRHCEKKRLLNGDLSWNYGVSDDLLKQLVGVRDAKDATTREARVEAVSTAAIQQFGGAQDPRARAYAEVAAGLAAEGMRWLTGELQRVERDSKETHQPGPERDAVLCRLNVLTALRKKL